MDCGRKTEKAKYRKKNYRETWKRSNNKGIQTIDEDRATERRG